MHVIPRSCNLFIVLECGDAFELQVVTQVNQIEENKSHKGKEKEKEKEKCTVSSQKFRVLHISMPYVHCTSGPYYGIKEYFHLKKSTSLPKDVVV